MSRNQAPLLLASASPRRHEILKQLRIEHQVIVPPPPPGEDEPQLPNESGADYVRRTAREKALHAAAWLQEAPIARNIAEDPCILCADTTVILAGDVLGKPTDLDDAARILNLLSGNIHEVHTAVAVWSGGHILESVSISTVEFKALTAREIEAYCATAEPMGKAGAYGIQGPAAAFVKHLSGSYTGVMGLPAYETAELLQRAGRHPG